jgi:hypothetical protein
MKEMAIENVVIGVLASIGVVVLLGLALYVVGQMFKKES